MSIIVMTDDDFEKNMQSLADQFHPLLAASFRARDTAQREALAQLQAEMPDLRANMNKALDLLQVLTSTKYTDRAFVEAVDEADEMLEQLRGKVVLKGQAEQQEAQGAQAGDERAAFVRAFTARRRYAPSWVEEEQGFRFLTEQMSWESWQDRAALATQPAPAAEHSAYDTFVDSIGAHPTREQLNELYREHHAGHPADFALDVLERWGPKPAVRGAEHGNQLLPCPLCGSEVSVNKVDVAYHPFHAACALSETGWGMSEDFADSWNRRATQPAAGEPEQKTAINADDLPTKKYPLDAFDFDSPAAAPVTAGEPETDAKQLAASLKLVRRWECPGQAPEWEFEVPGSYNRHVVASSEQVARAKVAQDVRREAPPAAAHGDDAVPDLVPGLQWAIDYCNAMLRQGNDRMLVEVIRTRLENVRGNLPAAMRSQGDGGADHA